MASYPSLEQNASELALNPHDLLIRPRFSRQRPRFQSIFGTSYARPFPARQRIKKSQGTTISPSVPPLRPIVGPAIVGTNGEDTLIGTTADEAISGLSGNDRLEGRAGADSLEGGAGNDTVIGGSGNDTVTVRDFNGIDTFDGGAGTDTITFVPSDNRNLTINLVSGSVGDGRAGGQRFTNFERVIGGGGNDRIIGNGGNNILEGGAGNDTVQGANGNDTAIVRNFNGLDTFDGGAGTDTITFAPSDNRNLTINLVSGLVGDGRAGGQQFTNFERVIGGGGNDRIIGNGSNNILEGGTGNDSLEGNAGNDELTGGAGQDRFIFSSINDGSDTITDFSTSDDMLQIDAVGFGGGLQAGTLASSQFVQGATAQDANDRFLYNQGQLLFDADGVGGSAAIQVATFTNVPTLSASDIQVVGNAPLPPPPPTTSSFDIEINFTDLSLTSSQRAVFSTAADRWEEVITSDIPDVFVPGFGLVDDVVIDASAPSIDGPGSILGSAGPTQLRGGSFLPARGLMRFDSADLATLETNGRLEDVILHEMGHVLGFGTIWSNLNLITGAGGSNPRFVGTQAVAEYNQLGGSGSIPVENTGGTGTRDGHWRESVFDNEIMTGFLNGGSNPISRLTIASLADLGYAVNLGAADPYTLPNNLGATPSVSSNSNTSTGSTIQDDLGEVILPDVQVLVT